MKEEYSRKLSPKLLKDTHETKKHIPQQGHPFRTTGATQVRPQTPPTCQQNQHEGIISIPKCDSAGTFSRY